MVVGGGNVAMDVARTARRQGAEVTLIALETREEMPASSWEVAEAEQEGIGSATAGASRRSGAEGKVSGLELRAVERVFDAKAASLPPIWKIKPPLGRRHCHPGHRPEDQPQIYH